MRVASLRFTGPSFWAVLERSGDAMPSILIAAHNEQTVIGRCLDSLLNAAAPMEFDVVVVANGCSDRTAEVAAARPGVRVICLDEAGKAHALNAGAAIARGFPRVYIDADAVVTTDDVRALCAALNGQILAAVPRRELDVRGCPLIVKGYSAVNVRLPAYHDALFGRGVIALSESAHQRFTHFPDMIADDLFLDSLFSSSEKRQVDTVSATIAAPRRSADLFRRLVRVRRANAGLRSAAGAGDVPSDVRRANRMSWFRDVVVPRPWLAPAALCYVVVSSAAALVARRPAKPGRAWARDDSTRTFDVQSGRGTLHG